MTAPKLPEGLEPVATICDDFREIIRDIGQHIAQGQQSEALMASMRPGYGTGVYTHIGHQMSKMLALVATLSDAQAALQEQAAEIAALREALTNVKNAGAPLANIAFNLAQQSGRTLDARECALFDACRKHWDAAIDAALVAAKEAKQ